MRSTYITAADIVSPLGMGLDTNFEQVKNGVSALRVHTSKAARSEIFCARISEEQEQQYEALLALHEPLTKLEKMTMLTAKRLIESTNFNPKDPKSAFILCTTKGNIDLLFQAESAIPEQRILFSESAGFMARQLGFQSHPIVVSNACISGVEGVLLGRQLIAAGIYDEALIVAADLVTDFTISGFYSLKAYANGLCRPFDQERTGVNLGECCAGVVLSHKTGKETNMKIIAGISSNDANHMTAPSREAKGLTQAIEHCLNTVGRDRTPDFISAHGTGTRYNDAMESKAFVLSGLKSVPFFSLKGIYGHTLGAAGLVETVISIAALKHNLLVPSVGFQAAGADVQQEPVTQLKWNPMRRFLKTASGFGGGNACLMVEKIRA